MPSAYKRAASTHLTHSFPRRPPRTALHRVVGAIERDRPDPNGPAPGRPCSGPKLSTASWKARQTQYPRHFNVWKTRTAATKWPFPPPINIAVRCTISYKSTCSASLGGRVGDLTLSQLRSPSVMDCAVCTTCPVCVGGQCLSCPDALLLAVAGAFCCMGSTVPHGLIGVGAPLEPRAFRDGVRDVRSTFRSPARASLWCYRSDRHHGGHHVLPAIRRTRGIIAAAIGMSPTILPVLTHTARVHHAVRAQHRRLFAAVRDYVRRRQQRQGAAISRTPTRCGIRLRSPRS